jgi:type I restriction enzyme S subunit
MLPEGWTNGSVESVCSLVSVGIVVNPSHYYVEPSQGTRAFRSGNVRENAIADEKWVYLSAEGHAKNKKSILRSGDLLVVRTGFAGTACVVTDQYAGSNCIDILFARPDPRKVLPQYLAQLTNSELGRRQVLAGQSGLAQKHLNVATYSKMTFGLPPLREQQRITEILSAWDHTIAATERLLTKCREQKSALSHSLLSSASRSRRDLTPLTRKPASEIFRPVSVRGNGDLPLLSVMQDVGVVPRDSLDRKVVMPDGSTESYKRVEPGNFVISLRSFEGGLEYSRHRGLVSPAYTVIEPRIPICDDFYRHYFKSSDFIGRLAVAVIGIRDGKQISYDDFAFLRLPAPSLREQQKIADALNAAEATCQVHQRQVERLRLEKRALMADLLTGRRRVRTDGHEVVQ